MSKQRSVVLHGEVLTDADGFAFFSVNFPPGTPHKRAVYDLGSGKWTAAHATTREAAKKAWRRMLRNFALPKPGERARMKFTIELED